MSFRKILFGEKMPDKDDPEYKERYQRDFESGSKFARALKLDVLVGYVQRFASNHSKLFLAIIFIFVLVSLAVNLYRISTAVQYKYRPVNAIERQEQELNKRLNRPTYKEILKKDYNYETDGKN